MGRAWKATVRWRGRRKCIHNRVDSVEARVCNAVGGQAFRSARSPAHFPLRRRSRNQLTAAARVAAPSTRWRPPPRRLPDGNHGRRGSTRRCRSCEHTRLRTLVTSQQRAFDMNARLTATENQPVSITCPPGQDRSLSNEYRPCQKCSTCFCAARAARCFYRNRVRAQRAVFCAARRSSRMTNM